MIQKHKWPVLEYDDSREVMVKPNRNEGYRFPPRAVLFFHRQGVEEFVNGCRADALYAANHIGHPCEELGQFETITRPFTVYRVPVNGVDICLAAAPLGAGAAAQFMDFLIACGCTRILAGGSCGALEDLPENAFLLPTHALRGEGASYCYLPPARWVQTDQAALRALEQAAAHFGVPARRCRTWTTDGFSATRPARWLTGGRRDAPRQRGNVPPWPPVPGFTACSLLSFCTRPTAWPLPAIPTVAGARPACTARWRLCCTRPAFCKGLACEWERQKV